MTLDEKFENFKKNCLNLDENISSGLLSSIGVKIKHKAENLLFERNVLLHSTVLPTADNVFMGAYSYMNEDGYIRGPVFIGRFCSIGRRVSIGAGMHSFSGLSSHPLFSSEAINKNYSVDEIQKLNLKKPRPVGVTISSDVWIGDGVVIVPGVNIGLGSVIGANTVVTKDVAPFSIIGGVPSKFLRDRFPEDVKNLLLKSQWWDFPIKKLKLLNYNNVIKFLQNNFDDFEKEVYATFQISGDK